MMKQATERHPDSAGQGKDSRFQRIRRWLPAGALLLLVAAGFGFGLHRHLSLTALAENRDVLRHWVDGHLLLALAAYASYVVNAAQFVLKLRAARLQRMPAATEAAPSARTTSISVTTVRARASTTAVCWHSQKRW